MSVMRGIDVSHYKSDLDLHSIDFDFVIPKATGGNGYVDDQCDRFVQQAISLGKKWGVFHYFGDGFNDNNPIEEADFFVNNCLGYIGHGILILDWERGGNPNVNNVAMAKAWLDHVFARTGVRPIIYMSLSLVQALDWSSVIAGGYGLWVASWPQNNNTVPNYGIDPASDPNPHWDGTVNDVLWQFTSTGRLNGYGGNLDCDYFYGTPGAWDAYARAANTPDPTTTTTAPPAPLPDPTTTTTTVAPAPPDPTTTTTTENGDGGGGTSTTTTTDTTDTQPSPPEETTTTTTQTDGQDSSGQGPGLLTAILAAIVAFVLAVFNRLRGVQ